MTREEQHLAAYAKHFAAAHDEYVHEVRAAEEKRRATLARLRAAYLSDGFSEGAS